MSTADLAQLVERLEKVTSRLESVSTGAGGAADSGPGGEDSPSVKAFDAATSGPLADFVTASNAIGGLVKDQAALLKDAMTAQRAYLVLASKSKKPTQQNDIVTLLKPTSDKITAIVDMKEKNRRHEHFNHLAALGEGVNALGWVTVEPTPAPFVKEMGDSSMFYINRVLKEFKDKDPVHSQWTKALQNLWKTLQVYVKEHHTTGLVWNPKGEDAMSVQASSPAPAARAGGAPPPPPPSGPPAPPPPAAAPAAPPSDGPDPSALFAQLNQGSDITSGLKKVTDDMKTHKNPTLRAGPAPFKPRPAAKPTGVKSVTAPGAVAKPVQKPPVLELQGKKWAVEFQENNKTLEITETNNSQTVYIYKCNNSVVQVKGKVNSITLDGCKKTAVVLDDCISTVEFINCQSVKAQINGAVPTVSIDKTDGCQIFLSEQSINATIISAKSSEMNIVVPQGKDGDIKEIAIAEQFRSVWNGSTFVTEVMELNL